ncbi:MAG: hypothetical protein WC197_07145 [Candidatus Gastranaerophilaceae bacterium]|jgi:hypothetical protein
MAAEFVVTSQLVNLGSGSILIDNEMTSIEGIILATNGFSDSIADLTVQANWIAGIRAKTVFPIMNLDSYEATGEDKVYTSALDNEKVLRKAKKKLALKFDLPFAVHQKLQTFDKADLRVFEIRDGKICFYNDGGTGKGFSTKNVNVGNLPEVAADGSAPALSPVSITYADHREWDLYGAYVTPTWSPLDLEPMRDVIVTAAKVSATEITITVKAATGLYDSAGAPTYTMVKGIAVADFEIYEGSVHLVAQTPTSPIVDNGDGTYTATKSTNFVTGNANIKAPSAQATTGLLIESTGDAAFTI